MYLDLGAGRISLKRCGDHEEAVGLDGRRETAELDRGNRLDAAIDEADPAEVDKAYG